MEHAARLDAGKNAHEESQISEFGMQIASAIARNRAVTNLCLRGKRHLKRIVATMRTVHASKLQAEAVVWFPFLPRLRLTILLTLSGSLCVFCFGELAARPRSPTPAAGFKRQACPCAVAAAASGPRATDASFQFPFNSAGTYPITDS